MSVLVLVGLDVILASPASRVAQLLDRPTSWLAAWMDPSRPLIPVGHLGAGAGSSGGGSQVKPAVVGIGIGIGRSLP